MQVVTNENFQQFIETGRVDPFKPPEASKAEEPALAETKEEPARGIDGKFVAKEVDSVAAKEVDKDHAAKTAGDDDTDDADLPEKVRQKIGKKHRAMREAEEFAEQQFNERKAADRRAEKAQQELDEIKAKSRPATAKEPTEPKPEDFATVADYTKAAVAFGVQQELKREKAQTESRRIAEEAAAADRAFGERVAATQKEHPDYADVVGALSGTAADNVHVDVLEYIKESDVGPKLLYHLAKTPSEIVRLQKLSPRKAIAELGKLESKMEPAKAPETASIARTVSQAPAPITTIEAAKTVVQTDPAKMNFKELYQFRKQEAAAKRR